VLNLHLFLFTVLQMPSTKSFSIGPTVHLNGRCHQIDLFRRLRAAKEEDDIPVQQAFEIDEVASIAELNKLSRSIDGPHFDDKTLSLEDAKNQLWNFVEDIAEADIDEMSIEQLTHTMEHLGGDEFGEGTTIEQARKLVQNLANDI